MARKSYGDKPGEKAMKTSVKKKKALAKKMPVPLPGLPGDESKKDRLIRFKKDRERIKKEWHKKNGLISKEDVREADYARKSEIRNDKSTAKVPERDKIKKDDRARALRAKAKWEKEKAAKKKAKGPAKRKIKGALK